MFKFTFLYLRILNLISLSSADKDNLLPFYYFAPNTEGFGARYLQLKHIAYEVVLLQKRPLILIPYSNQLHHKEVKLISLCDILILPRQITCTTRELKEIIRSESCKIIQCNLTNQWHCRPCAFIDKHVILGLINNSGRGVSVIKQFQNVNFEDLGIEQVKKFNFAIDRYFRLFININLILPNI